METYRLKNIMILTLALVNVFLLGLLGLRQAQQLASQRQTVQELTALFDGEGVALSSSAVSFDPPPAPLSLERSLAAERAAAAAFLSGDLTVEDEGGGIYLYSSDRGQAVFRASGSFEITGSLGKNPASLARDFCRSFIKTASAGKFTRHLPHAVWQTSCCATRRTFRNPKPRGKHARQSVRASRLSSRCTPLTTQRARHRASAPAGTASA